MQHFEHRQRHLHRGVEELAGLRHFAQALVDRRQQVVLEAFGMRRLLVDLLLRRSAQRVLHLIDRARDDEPQGESQHAADGEVVEHEPDRARNAEPGEPFDPGAQRGSEDEGEEDECQHELELPQGERDRDDRDHDQRGKRYPLGGVLHNRDLPTPRESRKRDGDFRPRARLPRLAATCVVLARPFVRALGLGW